MTSRAVVSGSTLVFAIAACTAYTTNGSGEGEDAASSASSASSGAADASGSSGASSSSTSGSTSASSGGSSSATSSASSSASSTSGGPLGPFEQQLLDAFNEARANATPAPDPALAALYWDYEAAATCQSFTDQCSGSAPSGMVNGGGSHPFSAEQVIEFMLRDQPYYNHGSNTCGAAAQDQCILYKMVVKRTVVKVGCSLSSCGAADHFACIFTSVGDLSGQPY